MYLYEQQILVTLGVVPQGQGVYIDIPAGYPADMHEPRLARSRQEPEDTVATKFRCLLIVGYACFLVQQTVWGLRFGASM
jgi:hypothetical protein